MFEVDQFVADCRAAYAEDSSHKAIREVAQRAFSNPREVLNGLGEPERAGVYKLHHSPDLTILNVVWGPHMTLMPHNHEMWAVISMYSGREDNIYWRRIKDDPNGTIEAAGADALSTGDCHPLGKNIIHSVTNPINKLTGAIHIYGGDFFETPRSEWDPQDLTESSYDVEKNMGLFEKSNRLLELDAAQ